MGPRRRRYADYAAHQSGIERDVEAENLVTHTADAAAPGRRHGRTVLELVTPDPARFAAWSRARKEWGPGLHEDGFGIGPDDEVDTPAGFGVWVDRVTATPGVRSWWIVEGTKVLGGISLRVDRHPPAHLGHIGYGVRPSARGQGVASWALDQALPHARSEGLDHVLLVCLSSNVGSIKTIEGHHGVRIASRPTGSGELLTYRIDL